ncbi:hypothetical protein FIM08_04410 [SAR202 cluster bacterium AC-647-N09_OGT_505m]|nr:hypothetical protein [SAR202 cluster bacterium AC-647-N09_OGT_505m]
MSASNYELLHFEREGHVAIITLNRPERLNALNANLRLEFRSTLNQVASTDNIRAVILTGSGRGFCAGADVNGQKEGLVSPRSQEAAAPTSETLSLVIRALPQPVIAAVNGVAAGMGMSIALACDIRIASEKARFASIFIKRSSVPDTGATYLLPQQVAPGIAAEMALTGRVYDAQWALEKGLVNRVVPEDQLMKETMALAKEIVANSPLGIRVTKQLLYRNDEFEKQIDRERTGNAYLHSTAPEDRREAVVSFLEKREPVFTGR